MNNYYGFVYKTTNLVNSKIYVGQSILDSKNYLGSGKLILSAIKKYGIQNFKKEILEYCISKEQLNEREIFWISELGSSNLSIGYNISKGGTGGPNMLGKKLTKEQRNKISVANKGRVFSKEHIRNLSVSHINSTKNRKPGTYKHSEETKQKLSRHFIERADRIGRKPIPEKLPRKIRVFSIEERQIISDKIKNLQKLECPHCSVIMKIPNVYQYHFDRCKKKIV